MAFIIWAKQILVYTNPDIRMTRITHTIQCLTILTAKEYRLNEVVEKCSDSTGIKMDFGLSESFIHKIMSLNLWLISNNQLC